MFREPSKYNKPKFSLVYFYDLVILQWLEHLWDHGNMFGKEVVRVEECEANRQVGEECFFAFLLHGVCCLFLIRIASSRRF